MATPTSFWKKYRLMIPPDQNPHQTVTFSGYWCISRGLVPNSIILLVHISIHPKMGHIAKDDLFGEIWVNFQLLQNPTTPEHTTLSMVIYLKFLGQLNFIGVQTQVPTQNSPSWSRRKAKLWTTRNWPLRVFPYTLRTAAMFSADFAFRWHTGLGWLFIEPVNSNLATKRRIVDSAEQLWRG